MPNETTEHPSLPFVGPRPFRTDESGIFFGRPRETSQLVSLLFAHRAVLFYAQSGAGKSSLINAGVIPRLKDEGFHVLPPTRVQGAVPHTLDLGRIDNIYVLNALLGFSGGEADPESFLGLTFSKYLSDLEDSVGEGHDEFGDQLPFVLIFDQFEELFTAYPHRWKERKGFFDQLVDAMETLDQAGRG
jgi:hypothetical protein